MRIILDNKPVYSLEWPKEKRCRNCKSILEVSKNDIIKGDMFYSEREIDRNVDGFNCPVCKQFSAL